MGLFMFFISANDLVGTQARQSRRQGIVWMGMCLGALLSVSPVTVRAQALVPNELNNEIYQLGVDSRAVCLSTEEKVRALNAIPGAVARLVKLHQNEYAANVRALAYDIKSKPPCDYKIIYYTGGYVKKDIGGSHIEERFGADGHLTDQFDLVKDPLGGGFDAGFYVSSAGGAFRYGPFVSVDFSNLTINQTFTNGSYLGTTSRWYATAGAKAGFVMSSGPFIYALAGVGAHNMDMHINFGGPISSQNATVPGGVLGAGVEFQPTMLQKFALPVSLYLQYQHAWWAAAQFNAPPASPLFNYSFRRDDDAVLLGFHVQLGSVANPVPATLITKAPAK